MSDFYDELEESFRLGFEPQAPQPPEKIQPWGETRIVGKALPRLMLTNGFPARPSTPTT